MYHISPITMNKPPIETDTCGTLYNPSNSLISPDEVQDLIKKFGDIGLKHRNISLYRKAFIHRSYCVRKNENVVDGNKSCPPGCLPLQEESNERLEFLGDSVISLIVATYLYKRYPDENEGFLTRIRTKLVNGVTLAFFARELDLGKHLVLSQLIENNGGRTSTKLLEDCFEAFVGALYTDFNTMCIKNDKLGSGCGIGYQVVEKWLVGLIEELMDFADLITSNDNHKERLIRFSQTQFGVMPKFIVTEERSDSVTVIVKRGTDVVATATADNRKAAECHGALLALKYFGQ